jgi:hypothetical protein
MQKLGIILMLSLLLVNVACTEQKEKEEIVFEEKEDFTKLPFDQRVKREAESKLSIPATEKYTLKVYKEHLNSDNSKDAIITVNRYQFALDEAAKAPNPAQIAELGYTGNYNFFFFYDGQTKLMSEPIAVPSSPKAPLKVNFENVQSEVFKDATFEYRIRNSAFKNYYSLNTQQIQLIFQWKLFDYVGTNTPEAIFLEYADGSMSMFKDILIFKGSIRNYAPTIEDIYTYNPVIDKQGGMLYRFFYDPRTGKYMTKQ